MRIYPVRLGVTENHTILRPHPFCYRFEVLDLRRIDVRIQLHVGADQPPTPRKCQGKIASRLRSEEHTSELQSRQYLVCRLLLEKKKKKQKRSHNLNHK